MPKKFLLQVLILILVSTVLSPITLAAPPTDFQTTQLIGSGLSTPTGFDIAPDGRVFILEQDGTVYIYKNGQLLSQPFAQLPVSQAGGDLGLLGVAFDPNFNSNHYVYFYYTTTAKQNRIVRMDATNDVSNGSATTIYETNDDAQDFHAGGTIRFGPDGKIYLAIGDNQYPPDSQNLSNPQGKVLRINSDGSTPTDNPYYGQSGKLWEIWASGVRNPFRFQFDSASGKLYLGDVGQASYEEINVITKGSNYGWPTCEGNCGTSGMSNPLYAYNHNGNSASVTGGLVYRGSMFPASYYGRYFFGDYAQGFVKTLTLDASGNFVSVNDFDSNAGTVVDLKQASDGSVYYLTIFPGSLYKITYSTANHVPVAKSSANVSQGNPPLNIQFSSAGSNDPDDTPLTYSWNFGDGSTSPSVNPSKTYNTKGTYTVLLTVSDGIFQAQATPLNIVVGTPPTLNVTSPGDGSNYQAGQQISYAADATSSGGQSLPVSAFTTEIIFHHDMHIHPFLGPLDDTNSGQFTIPTIGETSPNVWYEVKISATDSDNLTATKSVFIYPQKVNLEFKTLPANGAILVDSQLLNTPTILQSVVGFQHEIDVPATQIINGIYYAFDTWSDGGVQKHFITTPTSNATYTATLRVSPSQSGQAVSSFTLINADNEQVISGYNPIPAGTTLNLATLPTKNLNIRANTTPVTVGSVRFALDSNSNYGTENNSPYALASDTDGNYFNWTPSVGTHTVTATPYTNANAGGTAGLPLSITFNVTDSITPPPPPPSGQSITSFTLINAESEQVISSYNPITNNSIINLSTLPSKNINIRANTNPATVGSVRFALDGNNNFGTENNSPYALTSDNDGNYFAWNAGLGSHTITAIPYSGSNAEGTAGTPLTITITLTDSITPPPSPPPVPTGPTVTKLILINADTNQVIVQFDPLEDGAVINLENLDTNNLNIRAITNPTTVGSVRFGYDGNSNFRTENMAPYAIAGDENGDYLTWIPTLGEHTISATAFSNANAVGSSGPILSIKVNVQE